MLLSHLYACILFWLGLLLFVLLYTLTLFSIPNDATISMIDEATFEPRPPSIRCIYPYLIMFE